MADQMDQGANPAVALQRARPKGTPLHEGLWRWLPGVHTILHYRPAWLTSDLVAGLVLTAILVPVGMGYAEAAGLQPISGLYTTIAALIAYAIFGPSRILVLGPDSALASIVAATPGDTAGRRRSGPGRHVCRGAGRADGRAVSAGRAGQAGLYHQPVVQAHPLRLHERYHAHRAGEPAA